MARDFLAAVEAARAANRRAANAKLTVRDHRVLAAVIDLTAMYSRTFDRVYLAQVAAAAFGVDEAKPWMCNKARESLIALEREGVIWRQAPKGRGWGRQYVVSLVPLDVVVTHPDCGVSDGTDSEDEADVTHPEAGVSDAEPPPGNAPRPRGDIADGPSLTHPEAGVSDSEADPVTHPDCGTPTGEIPGFPTSPPTTTHDRRRRQETKIEPLDSPYPDTYDDDPVVQGWRQRHTIPNNTHPPTPAKRVFREMARRRLAFLHAEHERTGKYAEAVPPKEITYRCDLWVDRAAKDFKAQHGERLNDLLTHNPGRHPDWYVFALDRTLSKIDWSIPSERERHLHAVPEAS